MRQANTPNRRDTLTDALDGCASSSNTNRSCYPVSLTAFVQGQDASFIWNPTLSTFTKTNRVNITIYDGSDEWDGSIGPQNMILSYRNLPNPASGAGLLKVPVNDSWWGSKGAIWVGNVSYPFFWTIWGADETDTFTIGRQPMFAAIQTTLPDSVLATMKPTPISSGSVSAGSITPPPSSSASNTPKVDATSHVSANHTAVIAGVVCSLVGVALLLCLFLFIHRHRLKRRPPVNTLPDPMLNTGLHEKQPLQPPSKSALDLEMHRAHQRLQALRYELQAQPQTGTGAEGTNPGSLGSQNENAELRAQIQMLTAEVERLRSMGAEPPPAYSIQE
ncbi:hypothetical protein MVEN_00703800 [Mycena venus]|uniref:Uncharacterized protein n=1 Tax=Mycena venus TaxID=2733690 RepID=A0A8H7D574_9AGAR|nr:hypothetical protein MVEN_00703800 [Mycena venus]